MNRKLIYGFFAILMAAVVFTTGCTKEEDDVRLDPKLSTTRVLDITSESATIVGFVIAEGDGFTERGVAYDIAAEPTIDKYKTVFNADSSGASFEVPLTGLDYATKYYARAYAINASGTIYGEEVSFTTLPVVPTLTTTAITDITGNSASGGGEVTIAGGADVTARGVCFSINEEPTIEDGKTVDGDGTGVFTSAMTGLLGNQVYYARAYATNSAGTGYGPQVTFTTLVDFPVVATTTPSEITKTSAVSGGFVSYDGGDDIIERGLIWGLSAGLTIDDTKIIDATADTGTFVANLTGLELSTPYYVVAYATNSAGTAYGDEMMFTTLADITQFWVVGGYNGWDNSDAAEYIISTETSEGAAEGYVYLTAGEIKLVTDHSWDDAHTFGDDGSGGLTNPGSNIVVAEDGYYLIKANLSDMSYSLTKTEWGVIGAASPLGWDDETPLIYNMETKTWQGVMHMTADEFKFRANHSWDYNYGSTAGDNTLNAGGDNIALDTESDYAFELNLSVPNEYTYTAYRWGLIGDATPDGWDADQNMTWDADNGVFTITLDLVIGAMKFRANDGWDVNYGGSLDGLTPGGDNIAVAEAGNYTITFDPWALVATVTKN